MVNSYRRRYGAYFTCVADLVRRADKSNEETKGNKEQGEKTNSLKKKICVGED